MLLEYCQSGYLLGDTEDTLGVSRFGEDAEGNGAEANRGVGVPTADVEDRVGGVAARSQRRLYPGVLHHGAQVGVLVAHVRLELREQGGSVRVVVAKVRQCAIQTGAAFVGQAVDLKFLGRGAVNGASVARAAA